MSALAQQVATLPDSPGVYLFKDPRGVPLYVGKAKSIRKRVSSHLQRAPIDPIGSILATQTGQVDFILTNSEIEALVLENTLIKQHQPRYNIKLKDDKSYPFVKITLSDPYPTVLVTRRIVDDGSRYFGPYGDVKSLRRTLKWLRRHFPVRNCRLKITRESRYRPCMELHVKRCTAPCVGGHDLQPYRVDTERLVAVLAGRQAPLLRELQEEMKRRADRQEYEAAAKLRDQIRAIERTFQDQKAAALGREDSDVLAFARSGDLVCVTIMAVREGLVSGQDHYLLEGTAQREAGEILAAFLQQHYARATQVPPHVLVQSPVDDPELLATWLAERAGQRVEVATPQRGEKLDLVELAAKNAQRRLDEALLKLGASRQYTEGGMFELQQALGLRSPPHRIEAFDISTLGGHQAVGSLVAFEGGVPKKSDYRRFRIRTVEGQDDFAMMREVVRRRYGRLVREGGSPPDLVLVDGGPGQLGAALEALQEAGLSGQPAAGLAKRLEELYLPGRADPLRLPVGSKGLFLVQRVRDEAHRFAIAYHRTLRAKAATRSELDEIDGIGPKRRQALLRHFGSVERLREASAEAVARVPGMNRPLAERVKNALSRPSSSERAR